MLRAATALLCLRRHGLPCQRPAGRAAGVAEGDGRQKARAGNSRNKGALRAPVGLHTKVQGAARPP